jgi:hypothetical protein
MVKWLPKASERDWVELGVDMPNFSRGVKVKLRMCHDPAHELNC